MAEYIEREAALYRAKAFIANHIDGIVAEHAQLPYETCNATEFARGYERGAIDAVKVVLSTPAADVEVVKPGRWIPLEYDGYADGFPVTVGNSHRAGCIEDYGITGKKGPTCGCPKCGGYSSTVYDPVTDTNTCTCGWTDSTTNVTVQEWIPVSERLPEPETEVWILAKCGNRHTITNGMYEDGSKTTEDSNWWWQETDGFEYDEERDAYLIPEGWWEYKHYNGDDEYNHAIDDPVTHWMPLPQPPKGE